MPAKGVQDPVSFNLLDEVLAGMRRLEERVTELEAKHRTEGAFLIKIFGDEEAVAATSWKWAVPLSVDGLYLEQVEAFVTTEGTTDTEIDIFNLTQSVDMLTENLIILATKLHSSPTYVLNNTTRQVFWQDQISIDVGPVGSGALGLGVILEFQ